MTDTDIIKRAVELAPGWDLTEGQLTLPSGHFFVLNDVHAMPRFENPIQAWMLDALAAALVREVDATDAGYHVRTYPNMSEILTTWDVVKQRAEGPDRTENTMKVCVEFLNAYRSEDAPQSR